MDFEKYFKGKKAKTFWINVALMVFVLILAPTVTLFYLDYYTHHGERVEVPSVDGMTIDDAQGFLAESGLIAVVTDSVNKKPGYKPGQVCLQVPGAGSEVKSGRMVYLTVIRTSDQKIRFPDVAGNMSVDEAHQTLKYLGFSFTPDQEVDGEDKGSIVAVYQGSHLLKKDDEVSTSIPLTLHVSSGVEEDTLDMEELTSDDVDLDEVE